MKLTPCCDQFAGSLKPKGPREGKWREQHLCPICKRTLRVSFEGGRGDMIRPEALISAAVDAEYFIRPADWYRWCSTSALLRDDRWSDVIIARQPFEVVEVGPVYSQIRYCSQSDRRPVRTEHILSDGEFLADGPLTDAEIHQRLPQETGR